MATGYDARRTTGRVAALAAGVLMLGSVWGGVASAADTTTTTTPPAPAAAAAAAPAATGPGSAPCQTATAALTQATAALQAVAGIDPTGVLKTAVQTATAQAATACAALPGGTTTTTTTTALPAAGAGTLAAAGVADRDCRDFVSQQQAQAYFTAIGGSAARNADRLDRNRNGIACEDYPYAGVLAPVSAYPAGTYGQVATVPVGGIETGDGSTAP